MLLLAGPLFELLNFIQVLSWIILPILASAILLAIYWNYKKKKPVVEETNENDLLLSFTGQIGYTNGKGEYVSFDHSELFQQFKKQLSYSHARYTALQHDFAAIDTKYAALAKYARTHLITFKKKPMEHVHEQLPEHLQADITKLAETDAMEKKALQSKLMQLEKSFQRLEEENKQLKEQISMETAGDNERNAIINKWREENARLKDKIDDQEYLQDLVDEKKAQLNFLQGQLEQRLKNLYQSEHQRLKAVAEAKEMKETKESLQNELMLKQDQIDKTQVVLCEKEELIADKQRLLNEKTDHIVQLEEMLKGIREQSEQLNHSMTENKDLVSDLQQQLANEQHRSQMLAQKLSAHRDMAQKLYKEFSDFVSENEQPAGSGSRIEQKDKVTQEFAIK